VALVGPRVGHRARRRARTHRRSRDRECRGHQAERHEKGEAVLTRVRQKSCCHPNSFPIEAARKGLPPPYRSFRHPPRTRGSRTQGVSGIRCGVGTAAILRRGELTFKLRSIRRGNPQHPRRRPNAVRPAGSHSGYLAERFDELLTRGTQFRHRADAFVEAARPGRLARRHEGDDVAVRRARGRCVALIGISARTQNGHIRNDTRDVSRRITADENRLICRRKHVARGRA
jgi:hypothetical protein